MPVKDYLLPMTNIGQSLFNARVTMTGPLEIAGCVDKSTHRRHGYVSQAALADV